MAQKVRALSVHPHTSQRPFPTHHTRPSFFAHSSVSFTVHSPTRSQRASRRSHVKISAGVGPGGGDCTAALASHTFRGRGRGFDAAAAAARAWTAIMACSTASAKYCGVSGMYASSSGEGSLSSPASSSACEPALTTDIADMVLTFAFQSASRLCVPDCGRARTGPSHSTMLPSSYSCRIAKRKRRLIFACLDSREEFCGR